MKGVHTRLWAAWFSGGLLILMLACGCTTSPWPRYETSLYRLFKEATPASRAAHLELLGGVVARAEKEGRAAPPGVQAEYGWFLCLAGRNEEGRRHLAKEATNYPESAPFVRALTALGAGSKPFAGETGGGGVK